MDSTKIKTWIVDKDKGIRPTLSVGGHFDF